MRLVEQHIIKSTKARLGIDDTLTLKGYYDSRADHYAHLLQNFLIENLSHIPELT